MLRLDVRLKRCAASVADVACGPVQRLCSILLVALAACGTGTGAGPVEPTAPPTSVRPGVNARYYDEDALGTWIERFEGERREVVAFADAIVAELELSPGMVVADVGAGTGLYTERLARAVGERGKLYATDIVPVFLQRLRELEAEEDLEQIEVVAATPRDPALPAESLDLVFMCDVYHHLEYPREYMRALLLALKPGGELILVDFERIDGVTSSRMLAHIRAGKETVIAELRAVGFELVEQVDLGLRENYFLRLRRPG